jgi:tRNA(Ile)-lysidine synthase TilS/MesJ
MNAIDSGSPGAKGQFLLGYLDRPAPLFRAEEGVELVRCERCGQPTTGRFCAFCRARAQILGEQLAEAPADRALAAELSDEVLPVEIYGRVRGATA